MEVLRIKTEGKGIRLRNVPRIWIEVESASVNVMVEGHIVSGRKRIEIYEDRLEKVLEMLRTPEHVKAAQDAQRRADAELEAFKQANAKALAEAPDPEAYIRKNTNISAEAILASMGYPRGLPPLLSCVVVNPKDPNRMIDAKAYLDATDEKRSEYRLPPPLTPENAQQLAMEKLAATLSTANAEMLAALVEALSSKKGK